MHSEEDSKVSPRKLAANQANALKSTGPRTPEGKAISSRNAMTHTITASNLVLSTEDTAEFEQLRLAYYTTLKPISPAEVDLVDEIIVVRWHQRRLRAMESVQYELQFAEPVTTATRPAVIGHALNFRALTFIAKTPAVHLINRQLSRLSREFTRLTKAFFEFRQHCPPAPDAPVALPKTDDYAGLMVPVYTGQNEPTEIAARTRLQSCFSYEEPASAEKETNIEEEMAAVEAPKAAAA